MKLPKAMPRRALFPEPFESYLQKIGTQVSSSTRYKIRQQLGCFLDWLELKGIAPAKLTPHDLLVFTKHLKKTYPNSPVNRIRTRKTIQRCLVALSKSGMTEIDSKQLFPNYAHHPPKNAILPLCAKNYLNAMASTHAKATVLRYKTDIGRLHIFLKNEKTLVKDMNRKKVEKLINQMNVSGLKPHSRVAGIVNIRMYLYWLKEHNCLSAMPGELILRTDFPKLHKRLPRPFSPELDKKIQKIFYKGNDIFYDGLLLMRFSGLRIGELILLEFDCLKNDLNNNYYLKVPLGKLKTERLVPLAKVSVDLVRKIQNQSRLYATKNEGVKLDRLILAPTGRHAIYQDYLARMNEIQNELPPYLSAKTHQLRHSCATELLNAGMNLVALKEFLGHKDINMTLKYAAVAPETIRKQFNQATERIKNNYMAKQLEKDRIDSLTANPYSLADLLAMLKRRTVPTPKSTALIRRIKRLERDLAKI